MAFSNGGAMQQERVFNLFIYFEKGSASEIGARFHKASGTTDYKLSILRRSILADHSLATRTKLPRNFTPEQWRAQVRLGGELNFFEPLFVRMRANTMPLYLLTPVVDGVPTWDQEIRSGQFRGAEVTQFGREGIMEDYLVEYTTEKGFDLSQLLNDDFFSAISLLNKSKLYVSSAKLLMSFIDTMAFIDHGDEKGNFTKWLDDNCDLNAVGVTSGEVWEFRNSIIHMTNLNSRSVLRGKVSRISPFIAAVGVKPPLNEGDSKPFNYVHLTRVIAEGVARWGVEINRTPDKAISLIERYDTLLSDRRFAKIEREKITGLDD